MGKQEQEQRNLIVAKALFFATAMSTVGWTRFQNNFYLDAGLTSHEIGALKSIGLMLKIVGEPFWSMIADLTDEKAIFGLCMIMQVVTMEMLRLSKPLTYNMIFLVKVLRTTIAPSNTLTNTASFKLTEGTNEGYGQQRVFGSIAWGSGAFIAGYLIDALGMNAVFYYTYFFNAITLFFIIYVLPSAPPKNHNNTNINNSNNYSTNTIETPDECDELLTVDNDRINKSDDNINNGLKARSRSRSLSNDGLSHVVTNNGYSFSSSVAASPLGSSSSAAANTSSPKFGLGQGLVQGFGQAKAYAKEVYMFLSHATCRTILINAFLYGIVMTVPETFLFISLEKDFHASRTYSGFVSTTSVLGCIPLFWYSTHYIAKYGHFNIIFMSECCCVVRLFAYALLSPSWSLSLYILPGSYAAFDSLFLINTLPPYITPTLLEHIFCLTPTLTSNLAFNKTFDSPSPTHPNLP